jgi:hypothetical protein
LFFLSFPRFALVVSNGSLPIDSLTETLYTQLLAADKQRVWPLSTSLSLFSTPIYLLPSFFFTVCRCVCVCIYTSSISFAGLGLSFSPGFSLRGPCVLSLKTRTAPSSPPSMLSQRKLSIFDFGHGQRILFPPPRLKGFRIRTRIDKTKKQQRPAGKKV